MTEEAEPNLQRQIERAMEGMPPISPILEKLKQMERNLETEPNDLAQLIMVDPVLSGKVLKLINSAYYGLSEQTTSLFHAVVLLGINTVKNLAMYTAALDKVMIDQKGAAILDPKKFWLHCLATAVATKMLVEAQEPFSAEIEMHFLGGLLHDLGKVLCIRAIPHAYQKALDESKLLGTSLDQIEMSQFGLTHAQAGAMLARKWKLDPKLVEAIENHHSPDAVNSDNLILQRLMIANNLCKQNGLGQSGNLFVEPWTKDLAVRLQLDDGLLESIVAGLPTELEKTIKFLNLEKEGLLS